MYAKQRQELEPGRGETGTEARVGQGRLVREGSEVMEGERGGEENMKQQGVTREKEGGEGSDGGNKSRGLSGLGWKQAGAGAIELDGRVTEGREGEVRSARTGNKEGVGS